VDDVELLAEVLREALALDRLGRPLQLHHRPMGPVTAWGCTDAGRVVPLGDGWDHAGFSCPCDPILISMEVPSEEVEEHFRRLVRESES
jgi:hypothetical protein